MRGADRDFRGCSDIVDFRAAGNRRFPIRSTLCRFTKLISVSVPRQFNLKDTPLGFVVFNPNRSTKHIDQRVDQI